MTEPRIATSSHSSGPGWDRFSIAAEVRRRGLSLREIAREAGLYDSACNLGLIGRSSAGARAIAAALELPFETLFATIPPYDVMILKAARRKLSSTVGRNTSRNNHCAERAPAKGKKARPAGQTEGGR